MLEGAILITLFINGLIILLEKWNVLNWLRLRLGWKVFDCYFCLSHHLAFISILPFVLDGKWLYLFIPLMVAGLINLIR